MRIYYAHLYTQCTHTHTQTQSLTSSWDETITTDDADTPKPVPPPLDIPKELYQMVDYIKRNGLETVSLQYYSGTILTDTLGHKNYAEMSLIIGTVQVSPYKRGILYF